MRHPTVIATIQARMNSARLPGKALRPMNGQAMLGRVLDRVRMSCTIDDLWVTTSTEPTDDALAAFAETHGAKVYRGSLDNVLGRMIGTADAANADALVRISGDSPLIDPAIIDRAVAIFLQGDADLVTNVQRRTFPKGQSVEVISKAALRLAQREHTSAEDLEHVTPWLYANPQRVRIVNFELTPAHNSYNFSVDTPADFAYLSSIISRLQERHGVHDLDAIIAAADSARAKP